MATFLIHNPVLIFPTTFPGNVETGGPFATELQLNHNDLLGTVRVFRVQQWARHTCSFAPKVSILV